MPTGAKMLYIRDLGMATYNLLNFKMRPVGSLGLGLGATNPPGSTTSGIGTYQSAVLVKPVGWESL